MQSAVELARNAVQVASPGIGLAAVAELRARLDALEEMHVENALRAGWSWSRVGSALGVTRQAAHSKHARRIASAASRAPAGTPGARRVVITGEARRAVRWAREEVSRRGAVEVGSRDLLLGVLRDPAGVVARALLPLGVSYTRMRADDKRSGRPVELAGTRVGRRARTLLEQSLRESVARRDEHLGVEHIALALLRERRGEAARALGALGVRPADAERRLTQVLAAE